MDNLKEALIIFAAVIATVIVGILISMACIYIEVTFGAFSLIVFALLFIFVAVYAMVWVANR